MPMGRGFNVFELLEFLRKIRRLWPMMAREVARHKTSGDRDPALRTHNRTHAGNKQTKPDQHAD